MPLREELTEAVLSRDKPGWRRVEISPDEYDDLLRRRSYEWPRVYVGRAHLTVPHIKRRFIVFTDYPVTSGELARQYLRECWEASEWGHPPKIGYRGSHPYWKKRAPLFVEPVKHRSLAYVDVRHAYWELVRPYTADHLVTGEGRHVAGVVPFLRPDEVDDDRQLRHAVVGALFSRSLAWLAFGEWVEHPIPSPFANPSLARITYDTMHAVAKDVMRQAETFAWLTDAAICARRDREAVIEALEARWGLSSRVVADGMGAVWSPSTYRVGTKVSLDVQHRQASYRVTPHRNIARVNIERMRGWRRLALASS